MTKKDYVSIAEAINTTKNALARKDVSALAYLVGNLQARFERDNPRFNAEKFKTASGFDYV